MVAHVHTFQKDAKHRHILHARMHAHMSRVDQGVDVNVAPWLWKLRLVCEPVVCSFRHVCILSRPCHDVHMSVCVIISWFMLGTVHRQALAAYVHHTYTLAFVHLHVQKCTRTDTL
jgi:hypothetical protein